MLYLSEVLKILDAALRHSTDQAARYAGLLASKLEADGDVEQARLIKDRLAKIPRPALGVQAAKAALPHDHETKSSLIDEEYPQQVEGLFSPRVQARFDEFVESIKRFDELSSAGVALPPRMLMYGPPGCGKTLAARVIASRLDLPLLTVRCDTLVSSLLGQTGRNLRSVFDHAGERPCILFLDEFDALGKARSNVSEVGELQRVVIALLQNLDALSPDTIVIAATNHEDLLDPAVWRRFGFIVPMALPEAEQRQAMWSNYLGNFLADESEVVILTSLSEGMSGAAIRTAAHDILRETILKRENVIVLPRALLRLARMRWLGEDEVPKALDEEIRALRVWAPKVFTWKAIEDTFQVSARQVQNILGDQDDRPRKANSARSRVAD
jgi:SpoVK/Ycf46/Vps4 family AAA+-type ATPase